MATTEKRSITFGIDPEVRKRLRAALDRNGLRMSYFYQEVTRRFLILAEHTDVLDPMTALFGDRSTAVTEPKRGVGRPAGKGKETVSGSNVGAGAPDSQEMSPYKRLQAKAVEYLTQAAKEPWKFDPIPVGNLRPLPTEDDRMAILAWYRENRPEARAEVDVFDEARFVDEDYNVYNEACEGLCQGSWGPRFTGDCQFVFEALKKGHEAVAKVEFWDKRFVRMNNQANWHKFKEFIPECYEAFLENTTTSEQVIGYMKRHSVDKDAKS